jgi:hypothetical protein
MERIIEFANRQLTLEEARAYLDQPISATERDNVLALIHWFRARYPSPLERLTYARRAHARWQRVANRE